MIEAVASSSASVSLLSQVTLLSPWSPFTCNEQNMSLFGYETQPIFHSPACWWRAPLTQGCPCPRTRYRRGWPRWRAPSCQTRPAPSPLPLGKMSEKGFLIYHSRKCWILNKNVLVHFFRIKAVNIWLLVDSALALTHVRGESLPQQQLIRVDDPPSQLNTTRSQLQAPVEKDGRCLGWFVHIVDEFWVAENQFRN